MFCMHQKHVYDYCYDYYIHFNIQIHIAVMCHYDMYQIILYTYVYQLCYIYMTYSAFMVYVFIFVICYMCINIFISRKRTTENRTERQYIIADISR